MSETTDKINTEVKFFKKDTVKKIVYGVVFEPDLVDMHNEWVSANDIEDAAHLYLKNSRETMFSHSMSLDAAIVESYIAPENFVLNEMPIKKGSWVVAMKVYDDDVWDMISNGDIVGFSPGGFKQFV